MRGSDYVQMNFVRTAKMAPVGLTHQHQKVIYTFRGYLLLFGTDVYAP